MDEIITKKRAKTVIVICFLILFSFTANAVSPDSLIVLYNNFAVIKALNNELDMTKIYLDSAFLHGKDNPALLNNLGNYYLCQGDYETAISFFEQSYIIDTTNKSKLFNWSVALYLSEDIDRSVEIMKGFLDGVTEPGKGAEFASIVMGELDDSKAGSTKLNKIEIQKLLEKARNKQKRILTQKSDTSSTTSGKATAKKASTSYRRAVPAGEKAIDASELANILFWIIL